MMTSKRLSFRKVIAAHCPPLQTDKTKLKQILLNLLSNAVKFTNRGTIRLQVDARGAMPSCSRVADTGVGIRPDEIDAIWEDFRQLDQSRTRSYGGTGLGTEHHAPAHAATRRPGESREHARRRNDVLVRLPMAIPAVEGLWAISVHVDSARRMCSRCGRVGTFPGVLVSVALPVPLFHTFTYEVPPELADRARPGMRVVVPFRNRREIGVIVETDDRARQASRRSPSRRFPTTSR